MTDTPPGSLVGQIIADRYRIDKRLGGGGMGEVYLAQHIRIKRRCAVKVLRSALSEDLDALQRFQREAENVGLISHPNVAQVYDSGEHKTDNGTLLYLAMEFIEGQSMQEVLEKDGIMHPDMVADVVMQAAGALDAAHAQQVLHRDVKPDNIMLARNTDGTYLVKLVDFGIARAMANTDKRVTQTGMVIGTPEFMSPEQISGEPLDGRSDLYSLGLVAFVALTGQGAFPETGSMESLILRLTSRPRTLIEGRPDVAWAPRLQSVFDIALAPQRDDRYHNVVDFATELSHAIQQMAPSDTSAYYRRALEARAASPVALTASVTPSKAAKSSKRDKTAVSSAASAPSPDAPPRPMGRPARATQVAYAGPTKRSHAWRNVSLLVIAAAAAVFATGKQDVVMAQVKNWTTQLRKSIAEVRRNGSLPAVGGATNGTSPRPGAKGPATKKPSPKQAVRDSATGGTGTAAVPVKPPVPPDTLLP